MKNRKDFIKEYPYYLQEIDKLDNISDLNKNLLKEYLQDDISLTELAQKYNLSINNCRGHLQTAKHYFVIYLDKVRAK